MYEYVIQAIAKDEGHIINEWIVHHLLIGFEHIYIYDDNSYVPIRETIKQIREDMREKVTVYDITFDFYRENEVMESEFKDVYIHSDFKDNKQLFIIDYFIQKHQHFLKWCAFIDIDEFFYLREDFTIGNLLKSFDKVKCLAVPWLMYGTSFQIQNSDRYLIMDENTLHSPNYSSINKCFLNFQNVSISSKSFIKEDDSERFKICGIHMLIPTEQVYFLNCSEKIFDLPIHLNHYSMTSVKQFLSKKTRPEVGHSHGKMRDAEQILQILFENDYNTVHTVSKYVRRVAQVLGKDLKLSWIDISDISSVLCHKSKLVHLRQNDITYSIFEELLQDEELRFYNWKEILPENFDVNVCKLCQPFVREFSDFRAKEFYIVYGRHENWLIDKSISLPPDFVPEIYMEMHPDLQHFDNFEAAAHYLYHGKDENRQYK